ncbi:MAG: BatD family protein [Bacteroidales bacterium]|nr:BatD family protein [Bacteroidales bacterium]
MNRYIRNIVILLASVFLSHSMMAQEDFYVDINVSNSNPSVNEKIRVDYILKYKGHIGSFDLSGIRPRKPEFDGFRIVDEGGGMDMNFGFGRPRQDMNLFKYSFILEPEKPGKFTISPFVFIWNNKEYSSGELNITVSKGNNVKKPDTDDKDDDGLRSDDLFAHTIINKNKVYKGEPVIVTHKLYSKKRITGLNIDKLPSYEGFWSEEIDIGELEVHQEKIDGEMYNSLTIGKKILFPQKSGTLDIGKFSLKASVEIIKTRKPRNLAEQLRFGNQVRVSRNVKKNIASPVRSIQVIDLPQKGKPDNFSGYVGSFRLETKLTNDTIKANQSTNYKVTISGFGNIKLIELPEITFPQDFEVYDPEVNTNSKITEGGISGTKSFDYLLIPRSSGQFKVPSLQFTYFDILKEKYVTLNASDYTIKVKEGGGASSATVQTYGKEEIKRLGSDIMYIYETPITLKEKDRYLPGYWYYWLLILLPPLGLLLFYFWYKRNQQIKSDTGLMKNRRATRLAQKRLKSAKKLKDENKHKEFYEEINRAFLGYFSDRFNIPHSEINRDNIMLKLKGNNVNKDHIEQSTRLMDECDYARFAPSPAREGNKDTVYHNALTLISQIEKDIK